MGNIGLDHDLIKKPKMNKGIVIILLAALVSLACVCNTDNLPSAITNLIGKEASPSSSDASTATILLQDDFSNTGSGWEVQQYDAGEVGYVDGAYFVTSTEAGKAMWGIAGKSFTDVTIEVVASQISGPTSNNNDYGVMCRMNENSGYSFNISGDGFYSIQRMDDSSFTDLVEWTESDKINTGNATNTIKAVCQGSSLIMYVNGDKLAEATDTTYSSGDIALATTTYESTTSEIHFDNLVVTQQ